MSATQNAIQDPHGIESGDNLELRIWLRLLACSNLVLKRLRRNLHTEFGLTLPTFDILVQINRPPLGPTMGELSERLMVSKGSVTDLVERLERRELVVRRADPHDGRVQHVALTARGKRLLERVIPAHDRWIKDAIANVDRRMLGDLHIALGGLKAELRAVNEAAERRTNGPHRGLATPATGAAS